MDLLISNVWQQIHVTADYCSVPKRPKAANFVLSFYFIPFVSTSAIITLVNMGIKTTPPSTSAATFPCTPACQLLAFSLSQRLVD